MRFYHQVANIPGVRILKVVPVAVYVNILSQAMPPSGYFPTAQLILLVIKYLIVALSRDHSD